MLIISWLSCKTRGGGETTTQNRSSSLGAFDSRRNVSLPPSRCYAVSTERSSDTHFSGGWHLQHWAAGVLSVKREANLMERSLSHSLALYQNNPRWSSHDSASRKKDGGGGGLAVALLQLAWEPRNDSAQRYRATLASLNYTHTHISYTHTHTPLSPRAVRF